MSKMTL